MSSRFIATTLALFLGSPTALASVESQEPAHTSCADVDAAVLTELTSTATVTPLVERRVAARTILEREVGVIVSVRAEPGLTREWLQRVIDCHTADPALDLPQPAHLLTVPGASLTVVAERAGYAVHVRGDRPSVVAEIRRRAEAITE